MEYGANYGYDYINVGVEQPVPGTPFTAFGGFGSTGKEEAGQDGYQDYIKVYPSLLLA